MFILHVKLHRLIVVHQRWHHFCRRATHCRVIQKTNKVYMLIELCDSAAADGATTSVTRLTTEGKVTASGPDTECNMAATRGILAYCCCDKPTRCHSGLSIVLYACRIICFYKNVNLTAFWCILLKKSLFRNVFCGRPHRQVVSNTRNLNADSDAGANCKRRRKCCTIRVQIDCQTAKWPELSSIASTQSTVYGRYNNVTMARRRLASVANRGAYRHAVGGRHFHARNFAANFLVSIVANVQF